MALACRSLSRLFPVHQIGRVFLLGRHTKRCSCFQDQRMPCLPGFWPAAKEPMLPPPQDKRRPLAKIQGEKMMVLTLEVKGERKIALQDTALTLLAIIIFIFPGGYVDATAAKSHSRLTPAESFSFHYIRSIVEQFQCRMKVFVLSFIVPVLPESRTGVASCLLVFCSIRLGISKPLNRKRKRSTRVF